MAAGRHKLFQLGDLEHIRRQVLLDGQAAGIYHYIAGLDKSSFFQDRVLIIDNAINALFFGVVESAYAPAKTELVDQRFLFREDIQRRFWPIAGEDPGG